METNNQYLHNPKWNRATRLWVTLIILIFVGWLFVTAMPLIEALIIAGLLAYLIDPIVQWLMRRLRLSRARASLFVYLVFVLIFSLHPYRFRHIILWPNARLVCRLSRRSCSIRAIYFATDHCIWLCNHSYHRSK